MARSILIPAGQQLHIVINDIIFFKAGVDGALQRESVGNPTVINDIIFLRMEGGASISFDPADITETSDGVRINVDPAPAPTSGDPNKLVVFDPTECYVQMSGDSILVSRWADDKGIKRKLFEKYDFEDLDYLAVVKDSASGRPVFNLYGK